jgi:hypothetical protein
MKSIITKNGHFYFIIISIIVICYNVAHADAASLVSTDKDSYNYGEVIKVNYSNALGKESDWICIVPSGSLAGFQPHQNLVSKPSNAEHLPMTDVRLDNNEIREYNCTYENHCRYKYFYCGSFK